MKNTKKEMFIKKDCFMRNHIDLLVFEFVKISYMMRRFNDICSKKPEKYLSSSFLPSTEA